MWVGIICPAIKVFKTDSWKFWTWYWDYKVNPPKDFLESTEAPYIIVPTAMKGIVLLYAKSKNK